MNAISVTELQLALGRRVVPKFRTSTESEEVTA